MRVGGAVELGEDLTVAGAVLAVGDQAPAFELEHFDGEGMRMVRLDDSAGSVRLLNVINSIDTPVCDVETRRWEELRADALAGVRLYTVSMDLPFALARWSAATGAGHEALSAHRNEGFGRDYGVLITEWRALQRAVFVIAPDGRVAHVEYVRDQMQQPDFSAAVDAATRIAGQG